jgi:ParB family chromosome partitioning protein
MERGRILIVEADGPFALGLAGVLSDAGHATAVVASGAEAEREVEERPPALLLIRAELPDVPGFALCARLRRRHGAAGVPVILLSSEAAPDAMLAHARTPGAADGYLAIPFDTGALVEMAGRLAAAAPDPAGRNATSARPDGPLPDGAPPPVPRRERRDRMEADDRRFLDRTFRSVSARAASTAPAAPGSRPPLRRELLGSPEGRAALLRDDLREREAQIASIAGLWEVREREVASVEDRVHRAEVAAEQARLESEELRRRLAEARELLERREREHGAALQDLLMERFGREKDAIEVVASLERNAHQLRSEAARRDDELARGALAVAAAEAAARRDQARRDDLEAHHEEARGDLAAAREAERDVAEAHGAREAELVAALADAEGRRAAEEQDRRATEALLRRREEDLARAREEHEREVTRLALALAERSGPVG